MMHCAGEGHPVRRDPPPGESCAVPKPTFDCPFDNGPYYSCPPLQAELCIAGSQSDVMRVQEKTIQRNCILNSQGEFTIYER